jgi:hypothetical protein
VFSEKPSEQETPLKSMVVWPHKLVWRIETHHFERYDLVRDPGERQDLFGQDSELDARLVEQIKTWRSSGLEERPPVARVD